MYRNASPDRPHPNAKLTWYAVRTARIAYKEGTASVRILAEQFGVSSYVMHSAIIGRTWKHLLDPPPVPQGTWPRGNAIGRTRAK